MSQDHMNKTIKLPRDSPIINENGSGGQKQGRAKRPPLFYLLGVVIFATTG